MFSSTKHDAENCTSRDFFINLGVALEMFFRRFSCKMQRARGGTNPNVGTVYPHSDHNGKHPRARPQRNTSL